MHVFSADVCVFGVTSGFDNFVVSEHVQFAEISQCNSKKMTWKIYKTMLGLALGLP